MLQDIAWALEDHRDKLDECPLENDDGKHSWRWALLPFFGIVNTRIVDHLEGFQEEYISTQDWDAPDNVKSIEKFHRVSELFSLKYDQHYTDVVAVRGVDRGPDQSTNSILLTEYYGPPIHWLEPKDVDVSELPKILARAKEADRDGVWVVTHGLEVKYLSADAPIEAGEDFLNADGRLSKFPERWSIADYWPIPMLVSVLLLIWIWGSA